MTRREEEMIEHALDYGMQHRDDMANPDDDYMLSDAYCNGWKAADAHQPSPWISVEERLPEEDLICEWVAVKLKDYPGWYKGYYSGTLWHYMDECGEEIRAFNVTHWMPIPLLPTKL